MDDHIAAMGRASNREQILAAGLRVVHERGFGATGVRDIVQAANVPQGSFTNHFASKEAFGLEILELYFANSRAVIERTLLDDSRSPIERLKDYIRANKQHIAQDDMRNGCLFGNFSAEVADHSELIRNRLVEIFAEVQRALIHCLRAAVSAGEIGEVVDPTSVASLIVSSLQGAILLAKAERNIAPVENFEQLLFSAILR